MFPKQHYNKSKQISNGEKNNPSFFKALHYFFGIHHVFNPTQVASFV